jgi:hypothetical protein
MTDKIFALLGLCHDGFRLVPIPNYKQPLESIIAEMSRLCFSGYRSLDLMCLRGVDTLPPTETGVRLPNWATNWPSMWSSQNTTPLEKLIWPSPKTFQSDPVLAASTNTVLRVEAIYLGKITGLSTSLRKDTQTTDANQTPKTWLFTKKDQLYEDTQLRPTRAIRVRREEIWKTLTMACQDTMDDLGLEIGETEFYDCFEALWTPRGRGSIYNTQIIDWIDKNGCLKIGA